MEGRNNRFEILEKKFAVSYFYQASYPSVLISEDRMRNKVTYVTSLLSLASLGSGLGCKPGSGLGHSGANQTEDSYKLYGNICDLFAWMPLY